MAKIPKITATSTLTKCKCCQYPIETEDFKLTCDPDELGQLGSAFPLYYHFLKYMIIILAIATCISAIPCVIGNDRAGHASMWKKADEGDQSDYVKLSLGNYGKPYNGAINPQSSSYIPMWQSLIHLVTMLLILATYPFFKYYQSRKGIEIDLQSADSSLYTVRITGLGRDWDKKAVVSFLEAHGRWVTEYGRTGNLRK